MSRCPSQWRCLTTVRLFNYVIATIHPRSEGALHTTQLQTSFTNAILSSQSTTPNCKIFDAEICRRLEPILQCLVIETSPPPSPASALHCRRTVQDLNISIMTHIVISRHTSSPHRYKTLPDFEFHQRSNGKYC